MSFGFRLLLARIKVFYVSANGRREGSTAERVAMGAIGVERVGRERGALMCFGLSALLPALFWSMVLCLSDSRFFFFSDIGLDFICR